MSTPRYVRPGEPLAMSGSHLHQDRKGFFWLMGSGPLLSERIGDAIVVHVRGELEHHAGAWCESYEGIVARMRAAYAGDVGERDDDTGEPLAASPPSAIVLRVDSPGGVVSGLTECVRELQRMRAEHPEISVTCYVDEMATSAAYALACSCDEIVCPSSAIIGSIGVISTMISVAARDKREGVDVRLLTSGARKADGHPHAPLSDDAIDAEMGRVNKLANAFFRLASKARSISVDKLEGFQAGIFLGKDAAKAGLVDAIMSFSDLLSGIKGAGSSIPNSNPTKSETRMSLALKALIKKTEGDLKTEKNPKKQLALKSNLAAFKKTKKTMEESTEEESAEDEGGEESAEDEGGEESAEDEGGEESAEGGDGKDEDEDEDEGGDGKDEDEDEDDEKVGKKALALVQQVTGMRGRKALGALQAIAATATQAAKDVATLRREGIARDKAALIAGAKGKYVTTKESAWLAKESMSVVSGFVEMRRRGGVIVHTDDTTIAKPSGAKPGTEESLPEFTRSMIDNAVASMPVAKRERGRAELVEAHLKAHHEQIASAGSASGRY